MRNGPDDSIPPIDAHVRDVSASEIEDAVRRIEQTGYAHFRGFMSAALAEALKTMVEDISADDPTTEKAHFKPLRDNGKFVMNLQYRHKAFVDLVSQPVISRVLMPFLNDPYYREIPQHLPNYTLGACNARAGIEALRMHIDSVMPSSGSRTWSMQALFSLDPQTVDNGCTYIVAGSHRSGEFSDRSFEGTTPVTSEPGDLIVLDSRLWHGALKNITARPRWLIVATYRAWWAKQMWDIPRGMPEEIYGQLTDAQKALMGYCSIPPRDHSETLSQTAGYDSLKRRRSDYFD